MPISLNKTQNVTTQQPVLQSSKPEENKSKISQVSTQTKVLVGTGLAALAVAGIYIATKGKSKPKNIKTDTNLTETVNTINEMTLDEFRQAGYKLSRGKAYTSNGELYTGSLKYTRKNGLKYVLEYENGLLVKNTPVIMSEKDFEKLGNKIVDGVAYTADGQKFTGFFMDERKINGYEFRALLSGGLGNLKANAEEINGLNVFPIPDDEFRNNYALTRDDQNPGYSVAGLID